MAQPSAGSGDQLASGPLHVDEIAARAKSHGPSLFRLLRALESIGRFTQVSPRVFANTPATEFLRRDIPTSRWAGVMLSSAGGGEFEAWIGLMDPVQSGRIALDGIYGYNWWEYLKRNPSQAAIFDQATQTNCGGKYSSKPGASHRRNRSRIATRVMQSPQREGARGDGIWGQASQ